ncbi:MAG: InlB B-repeat-containing protein [Oscillospiraceae bacterium]|nr:InlB B-repeat-containing protein [Oscillospiraceae bacterium]
MERKSSSKAITRIYNMTGKSTQIKKGLRRALTLLLAILFMLSTVAMAVPGANGYIDDGASQSVASHEQIISVPAHGSDGFISDDNGFIKFYVNQSTGGFYILPSGLELDESKPSSFGSFRIDGEEFVFGGNYPGAFFVMPPMINQGGTAQAVWYKNGLYISQYLNIVQNEVRANSYAVYIRYEIESAYYGETFNGNIEGRILIDTMFGAYDNLPVKISGGEALTYETVFDESNMPAYFGNDTSSGVYPRVYGLLIDSSVTRPSSLTFADLDNVSGTVFDYNLNTSQVITDSAVLLYFEGQRDSDGSVFFSTIYGFDVEASVADGVSLYDLYVTQDTTDNLASEVAESTAYVGIEPLSTVFEVRTEAQFLNALSNETAYRTIRLMDDIHFSNNWAPVNFGTGHPQSVRRFTIDGNGFIISLHVNQTNGAYAGLFGYVNGADVTIRNLGIENRGISVSGSPEVHAGGFFGLVRNSRITISTSFIRGASISAYRPGAATLGTASAGGLIGYANNTTVVIQSSFSSVESVSATMNQNTLSISAGAYSFAGGLVGRYSGADIRILNTYTATGQIVSHTTVGSGTRRRIVGGIVGGARNNAQPTTLSVLQSVRVTDGVINGGNDGGNTINLSGTLVSITQLHNGNVWPMTDWDWNSIWEYREGGNGGFPVLSEFYRTREVTLTRPEVALTTGETQTVTATVNPARARLQRWTPNAQTPVRPTLDWDTRTTGGGVGSGAGSATVSPSSTEINAAGNATTTITAVTPTVGTPNNPVSVFARIGGTDVASISLIPQPISPVIFNLAGGNVNGNTANVVHNISHRVPIGIINVPNPERDNYNFEGWRYSGQVASSNLTREQVAARPVTGDVTFTAQWERIRHTVTFNLNGGNIGDSTTSIEYNLPQSLPVGETNVPTPSRTNHVFGGWRENGAGEPLTLEEVAALHVSTPMSFTATWSQYMTSLIVGIGFLVLEDEMSSDMTSLTEGTISFLVTPDSDTIVDGNPTRIVDRVYLRDGEGADVPFTTTPTTGGATIVSFAFVAGREVHFELISMGVENTHTVEVTSYLLNHFYVSFFDRTANPESPFSVPNTAIPRGRDISVRFLTRTGAEVIASVLLIGETTSTKHPVIASGQHDYEDRRVFYFDFTMPNESATLDAEVTIDPNHRFRITPRRVHGNLNFSSPVADSVLPGIGGNYGALAGREIIIAFDYNDVHFEFHGLSVINIFTGVEYQLTALSDMRYSFTMPGAPVYVFLDVRQRPIFQGETQINHGGTINLVNSRSGASSFSSVQGYEGDRIEFGITNTDPRRIIQSVELVNAETRTVVSSLFAASDNRFANHFSGTFDIPAFDVVLRVILTNAPLLPVTVEADIHVGSAITLRRTSVAFGETVEFDFETNDTRHWLHRPVMRVFDESGTLLFEQFFQDDSTLRSGQPVFFVSAPMQRTDEVPASIVIGVYEINREFIRQLVSITPNSERATLFTHIYAHGFNMYDGDYGTVYLGTSASDMQAVANITFIDESTLMIPISEEMRSTTDDVTFYVRIHNEIRSVMIVGMRELRVTPFGLLGIVSDNLNTHSVILADNEAELRQLAGGQRIILRLVGNVRWNQTINAHEFTSGNVIFNGIATYEIVDGYSLQVRELSTGITITASRGRMMAGWYPFVRGRCIKIELRNTIEYIDTWAKNSEGQLNRVGTENIVIQYIGAGSVDWTFFETGLEINHDNAILLRDSIVFAGIARVGIGWPVSWDLLNLNLRRAEFGMLPTWSNFLLPRGVEARGRIDLNPPLISDIAKEYLNIWIGVSGFADIDTFRGQYSMGGTLSVKLKKVQLPTMEGEITLLHVPNEGLRVDGFRAGLRGTETFMGSITFTNVAASAEGLAAARTDRAVRVNLYGGGMNIPIAAFPPLTLRIPQVRTSITSNEVSVTGSAEMRVGLQPPLAVDLDVIPRLEGSISWNPGGTRFSGNVDMVLIDNLDFIRGSGDIEISHINDRFNFRGNLHASVQVPRIQIFGRIGIGPIPLAGVDVLVNEVGVSAPVRVLGWSLRAYYRWGGMPWVVRASQDSLEVTESIFNEEGDFVGYSSFGSNLSLRAASTSPMFVPFGMMLSDSPTITTNMSGTVHYVYFPQGLEDATEELAVLLTAPYGDISITNPDGRPFALRFMELQEDGEVAEQELNIPGINAVVFPAINSDFSVTWGDENIVSDEPIDTVMIRLPQQPGMWTITSSSPFESAVMGVELLPEIRNVRLLSDNRVEWSLANLNFDNEIYVLEIRLSQDDGNDPTSTNPGTLISEVIIADGNNGAASGSYSINPSAFADWESGRYYPRLILSSVPRHEFEALADNTSTDGLTLMPESAMNANSPITHTNPHQPTSVGAVELSASGDGNLNVQWQSTDNRADGYFIKIFDVELNPVFHDPVDEYDVLMAQKVLDISTERGTNGLFNIMVGGLQPGREFYVKVIPYASIPFMFDGEEFFHILSGPPVQSNRAELPLPIFPSIDMTLPGGEAIFDGVGQRTILVNNSFDFTATSTNINATFTMLQDGEVINLASITANSATAHIDMTERNSSLIQIEATSETSDTSFASFMVHMDNIPPPLFVNTGEDGQIYAANNGRYRIRGHSERGATIRDDLGNTTTVDSNGEFTLLGELPQGEESTYRTITARDAAGNNTSVDVIILLSDEEWEPPTTQPPNENQPPPSDSQLPPITQPPDNNQPPPSSGGGEYHHNWDNYQPQAQPPAQDAVILTTPQPRTEQHTAPSMDETTEAQPQLGDVRESNDEQELGEAHIAIRDPIDPIAPGYIQQDMALPPALIVIGDPTSERSIRTNLWWIVTLVSTAVAAPPLIFTRKKWLKLFKRRE